MTEELEKRVAFVHRLADAAGVAIRPYFRQRIDVTDKGAAKGAAFDPVTEADRNAEIAIRELLGKAFPQDGILGEEMGDTPGTSGFKWLLDPIDGTRAFITGQPLWGTLIALQQDGSTVLGLVDQPILGERFIGVGGRAELHAGGKVQRLKTRPCASLGHAVISSTNPWTYMDDAERTRFMRLMESARMTRFGGDCYAYAMLAEGFVDLIAETRLHIWDVQPLIPIIEGAGGIVTDWSGNPIREGGSALACGDARVHAEALKILQG